jgi:AraC-like DNA-binding protein
MSIVVHHVGRFPERSSRQFIRLNIERYRLQNVYPPHRHTYGELTVVVGGSGTHVVDGFRYPLCAGEVFLIHPGVVHWFEGLRDFQHLNIYFDLERFVPERHPYDDLPAMRQLLDTNHGEGFGFTNRLRLPIAMVPAITRQTARIERELRGQRVGRELMIRAMFHELIIGVARGWQESADAGGDSARVLRLIDHIEANLCEPLELQELAVVAGVSSNHLLRLSRRVLGTTPMAYVAARRLERAQELLSSPERSVTEIALSVGFCSGAHLANTFKRRYGMSPSVFRRRCADALDSCQTSATRLQ